MGILEVDDVGAKRSDVPDISRSEAFVRVDKVGSARIETDVTLALIGDVTDAG